VVSAKAIRVDPIAAKDAHKFVRQYHYSHKSVKNSQLHFGIFIGRNLVGVMQFGPSLDKRKIMPLVKNTRWNEFIELNRMALIDETPRNTESRALAVAFRLIRRQYPHIQWCVTFADATQCGDGTIYRAAGFVLTAIKKNKQIWEAPDETHARESRMSLTEGTTKTEQKRALRITRMVAEDTRRSQRGRLLKTLSRVTATKAGNILENGASSMKPFIDAGFKPLEGFQLRYIYFLDPTARERLTVPEVPFSKITELGASMYKGERQKDSSEPPVDLAGEGGAAPTLALQESKSNA